mgnify:CR=1 FL=1
MFYFFRYKHGLYKIAQITFDPRCLKYADDGVILHELLHVIYAQSKYPDGEEVVCSELERILLRFAQV